MDGVESSREPFLQGGRAGNFRRDCKTFTETKLTGIAKKFMHGSRLQSPLKTGRLVEHCFTMLCHAQTAYGAGLTGLPANFCPRFHRSGEDAGPAPNCLQMSVS
jgi:hypothetical protein